MTFLKWLGGKRQHVKILEKYLPPTFNNYYEPFLGSGAFYFYLKANKKLKDKKAFLSDTNFDLIAAFLCIQNRSRLIPLLDILDKHRIKHSKKYHRELRDKSLSNLEEVAARFIYFNRAGYSGIHRESKHGEFNVCAKNEGIHWLDRAVYMNSHFLLEGATIKCFDYNVLEAYLKPGDFVYLDPPYQSFFENGNRTVYGMFAFSSKHQKELKDFCDWCSKNKIYVMQSNSNSDLIWDLYEEYRVEQFEAVYTPNGGNRVEATELIIMNYLPDGNFIDV